MDSQTSPAMAPVSTNGTSDGIGKVMRDGQRLLESPMQEELIKLHALRAIIKVALDDFDYGNFTLLKNTRHIENFVRQAGERAALRVGKAA